LGRRSRILLLAPPAQRLKEGWGLGPGSCLTTPNAAWNDNLGNPPGGDSSTCSHRLQLRRADKFCKAVCGCFPFFPFCSVLWAGRKLGGKEQRQAQETGSEGDLCCENCLEAKSPGWQPPHSSTWTCPLITLSPCCPQDLEEPWLISGTASKLSSSVGGNGDRRSVELPMGDFPNPRRFLTGSILRGFMRVSCQPGCAQGLGSRLLRPCIQTADLYHSSAFVKTDVRVL